MTDRQRGQGLQGCLWDGKDRRRSSKGVNGVATVKKKVKGRAVEVLGVRWEVWEGSVDMGG